MSDSQTPIKEAANPNTSDTSSKDFSTPLFIIYAWEKV